ncbi:GspMb/PilO family protein [Trichothermofontia sichuanensis B231]|uniref:GspMb/PilO family protein n=1 Tax=Trichothermofontia sichuanensis TaxID=3045816 RepID=UPI002247F147|nr:GspMb/PilO family protein [Trichothermofontia sichuanensis]UZQ53663.1 GspMb/PilO family protein [Trichothermofontia sichuanensis B231]
MTTAIQTTGTEPQQYPSAFGITFTPLIGGVIIAVLGLAGGVYVLATQVLPAWQQVQDLNSQVQAKRLEVEQKQASKAAVAEAQANLEKALQRQETVTKFFSQSRNLDTLLLTLNQIAQERDVKINQFAPGKTEVVEDDSLGPGVKGKLERTNFTIELEGNFRAIQSVLRSIERLEPLLLIQGLSAESDRPAPQLEVSLAQTPAGLASNQPILRTTAQEPTLKTTFTLQAIRALSPEEIAAYEAEKAAKPQ